MPLKHNFKVSPTNKNRNWKVLEENTVKGIMVPKGFITDGASIPVGFRWLFPHGGPKFPAAVVHDYCYRTGCIPKEKADNIFKEVMLENEVPEWKAEIMYLAVKYVGGYSYKAAEGA